MNGNRRAVYIGASVLFIFVLVLVLVISNNSKNEPAQTASTTTSDKTEAKTPDTLKPESQKDGPANIELLKQANLYGSNRPANYGNMAFFENNQWVVFTIQATNGSGEGYIAVMNYVDGEWIQVIDGPGFTVSDVKKLVPESVATYYASLALGGDL